MTRQFRVGDIVNAIAPNKQVTRQPVDKVGVIYVMINGTWFRRSDVTLVKPVKELATKRGVKPYEDQFTPWNKEALRDSNPLIRDLANEISIMTEQQT